MGSTIQNKKRVVVLILKMKCSMRWGNESEKEVPIVMTAEVLGSTVGCVDCKLKFPTRRTTKNMLWEMDHSLLPLDAQCRAAEEELGQCVRVDCLLLIRSPSNSRSSDPSYKFAGAAQVHHL